MNIRQQINNLFFGLITILALSITLYSAFLIPFEKLNITFFALLTFTVFIGSTLQIQLPRTKIHLSFAEATIFYFILMYGVEAAVLTSALETLYASFSFRRKNINIKSQTIVLNVAFGIITTYSSGTVASNLFSIDKINPTFDSVTFLVMVLAVIGAVQFIVGAGLVASVTAIRQSKNFWKVLNENCFNALIMYAVGGIVAGLMVEAIGNIDPILLLVTAIVAVVSYVTYRRYVQDIKETSAKAEQAERERAELAEKHIEELQHHIAEQEKTSQALRESRERFRHAAYHDALTDLPNRNKFIETLQFHIEKAKHTQDFQFAVLFLDLNRFKTINDSLGHSMGDKLILHAAKRLANMVKDKDLVARFSGDEFAIVLSNLTDKQEVIEFTELIRQKIALPFTIENRQIFTSVSIGIAFGHSLYNQAEEILRDADIAMYHAKEGGKDFEIFNPSMHTRAVTLLQLETDLRHAIERNEMLVYYQPIIDLNSMEMMGFEALMRWKHPQRGIVPPGEFIPVSEETGLIIPLTLWILRESCSQIVKWNRQSPESRPLMISINLSGKHFAQPNLVEQVQTILEETEIDPHYVKLELTESAVMENAEQAILMLKQLRTLGVKLSIDDFGTGYSSLSYLHRFPIDMLKVDRSFVSTMEGGSENGEIVRTIIALAKTLKLNVIAEGIESIHQLHQLRVLGCEYGQGFLFSRPIPVDEIEKLLEDKNRWISILPEVKATIIATDSDYSTLYLPQ